MKWLSSKLSFGLILFMGIMCLHAQASNTWPTTSVAQTTDDTDLATAKEEALDLLENRTTEGTIPGCYTADDRETFRQAIETATTVEEVTDAINAYKASVQGVLLSDDENEYWYYIVSGPSVNYCQDGAIYDLTFASGGQLKWNDRSTDALCMWKFIDAGNGKVNIVNRSTKRYMKTPGTNGSKVTSEADVTMATAFNLESKGEQRAYLIRENSKTQPVHADKIGVVVAWQSNKIGTASIWHFDPVSADDLAAIDPSEDTWQLVWADEFDNDGPVNQEDWNFEEGFVRNQEPQWYQQDNAICKDGNLVFTARKERVKNTNYKAGASDWRINREYAEYTSSSISTKDKHDLKYGRIEVRAKIPVSSGAWPAI